MKIPILTRLDKNLVYNTQRAIFYEDIKKNHQLLLSRWFFLKEYYLFLIQLF